MKLYQIIFVLVIASFQANAALDLGIRRQENINEPEVAGNETVKINSTNHKSNQDLINWKRITGEFENAKNRVNSILSRIRENNSSLNIVDWTRIKKEFEKVKERIDGYMRRFRTIIVYGVNDEDLNQNTDIPITGLIDSVRTFICIKN